MVKAIKISGKKLATLRNERFYSQEEFSRISGMSKGNVARLEGLPVAGIYPKSFRKIAEELKLSAEQLFQKIGATEEEIQKAEAGRSADACKPPDPAPTTSQIDVEGMSRVELGRLRDLLKLPEAEQTKIIADLVDDRNSLAAMAASMLTVLSRQIANKSVVNKLEGFAEFCRSNVIAEFKREEAAAKPRPRGTQSQRQLKKAQ